MSASLEQIEHLFLRAMELGQEKRLAFLEEACGQDSALLARVQALLRAHDTSPGILAEEPRSDSILGIIVEKPGDWIGPYKLIEQVGEGGCGIVFKAEQLHPVRRQVAVKVIKLGMDTRTVVARFEAERQALALMDHPNIAKVFDAGSTQTGRPYFVMELVRGARITEYCDQQGLSVAQRLELFIQVCRAIQHAHHKGVIHRDIKPSNVLVSAPEGAPVPKVIDFGIAKAIEGRLADQTLFTSAEQFLGTPAYMSPEQARLNNADVDIRTDIYSLGVLLYELLTGTTPFDATTLLAEGIDAVRKTILEQEPVRPSTRLTVELAQQKEPANRPGLRVRLEQQRELISILKGDVDWIVMKCLEKERSRRYETANGLAMDLERYLKGEPVLARPPSTLYRLQKLVRRNKLAVSAAALVSLALLAGSIISTWEAVAARRAEKAQGVLRQEAERARAGEAQQRSAAEQRLYEALLGEARAKELSGRAGQRFESLDAITKAAAIHPSTDLSDAAVAALSLPDLREQKSWRFNSHWAADSLCFDDSLEVYAQKSLSEISVRQVSDDRELVRIQPKGVEDLVNGVIFRRFSAGARFLAASCLTGDQTWHERVWDLHRSGSLALEACGAGKPDFSPDGQAIALINTNGTVSLRQLSSGKELMNYSGATNLNALRFNPDGTKLAGLDMGSSLLRVWETLSGRLLLTIDCTNKLSAIAWSQDGTLLATGFQDGEIALWSADSGALKVRPEGHESWVSQLAFSRRGDLLGSAAWDHTLRLWDPASGRQLVTFQTEDTGVHFSPDDQTLAYAVEGQTAHLLQVAHATGYERLAAPPEFRNSWSVDFSPDGRLAVTAHDHGVVLWDVIGGKELGVISTNTTRSAHFETADGLAIIASAEQGLFRYRLHAESTARFRGIRIQAPEKLAEGFFRYSTLGDHGIKAAVSCRLGEDPLIVDLRRPTQRVVLSGHPGAEKVALDQAGRWAATGTWKGRGVRVYDASTGQTVCDLPTKGTACVAFSPNGDWLATSDMNEFRLWKTGTWEPSPNWVPGDGITEINQFCFSPDGKLLALARGPYQIAILRVPTCETIATLRPSMRARVASLGFSPDGTRLAAVEWLGHLDVWDLRVIRNELAKLNLDWLIPRFDRPAEGSEPEPAPVILRFDSVP